jgi:hypothetical protein
MLWISNGMMKKYKYVVNVKLNLRMMDLASKKTNEQST